MLMLLAIDFSFIHVILLLFINKLQSQEAFYLGGENHAGIYQYHKNTSNVYNTNQKNYNVQDYTVLAMNNSSSIINLVYFLQ